MSPARTLSANKKTKNKPAEKGKITPKRLVEKDLSVGQSSAESNDMKILDAWNGLKIVKVVNHIKPKEFWEIGSGIVQVIIEIIGLFLVHSILLCLDTNRTL